jgi:hypothetical protein
MTHHGSALFLAAILGLALGACGDDEDEDDSAARLASCKQVCDEQAAAACPFMLPAETCKQFCDIFARADAACQEGMQRFSDCQLAQPDICDTSACEAEQSAFSQACEP